MPESIHRVPLAELAKAKEARRKAISEQVKAKYTEDQVGAPACVGCVRWLCVCACMGGVL